MARPPPPGTSAPSLVTFKGDTPLGSPDFGYPDLPRKEDCPGCVAGRDEHGRMPIGLCGPDCLMRRR